MPPHIIGWQDGGIIQAEEVYRFPNGVTEENGHLVWDVAALTHHVKEGIAKAKARYPQIVSLSIDTWGVDYVLLKGDEEILPVYAYRDSRTEAVIPKVHETIPFSELYRLGWDEQNGGNISYLLDTDEVAQYLDLSKVIRTIPLGFDASAIIGKIFIVTGTGKYFKNVDSDPETNLGIVRIAADGQTAELLWGYKDGGKFTSEFPAHLMSHMARLSVDPQNRVVMHCHPTHTLAMNYVHELDEKKVTHTLWEMCTECIVVFPDGVGVLPWMLCGTNSIGEATAEKNEGIPAGYLGNARHLRCWQDHGRDLRSDRNRGKGRPDLYAHRPSAPDQYYQGFRDGRAGRVLRCQVPERFPESVTKMPSDQADQRAFLIHILPE